MPCFGPARSKQELRHEFLLPDFSTALQSTDCLNRPSLDCKVAPALGSILKAEASLKLRFGLLFSNPGGSDDMAVYELPAASSWTLALRWRSRWEDKAPFSVPSCLWESMDCRCLSCEPTEGFPCNRPVCSHLLPAIQIPPFLLFQY